MIQEIIDQIKEADKTELAIIEAAWSRDGQNYPSYDWPLFWDAVRDRKLELAGTDPDSRPF